MIEGICQLCLEKKELCKAHIVPQSITKYLKNRFETSAGDLLFTNAQYPKRSPNGIYDPDILCGDCDGKFSKYENIVLQLLFKQHDDSVIKYLLETEDDPSKRYTAEQEREIYNALRLFSIFTLWKASISRNEFVKNFSLGEFENDAYNILQGKIVDDSLFKICIWDCSFVNQTNRAQLFTTARFRQIDEFTWCYLINLGIYQFYIFPNEDCLKGLIEKTPSLSNLLINETDIRIYPMPLEFNERHNENFQKFVSNKKR